MLVCGATDGGKALSDPTSPELKLPRGGVNCPPVNTTDTRVEHRLSNAAKAFRSSSSSASSAFRGKLCCGGSPHKALPSIATGGPGSQAKAFFTFLGSCRSLAGGGKLDATVGTTKSACICRQPCSTPRCSDSDWSTPARNGTGLVAVLPPSFLASCAFNLWSMACIARSIGPSTSSADAGDRCTGGLGVAKIPGDTRAGDGVRGLPTCLPVSATAGGVQIAPLSPELTAGGRAGDGVLAAWVGFGCCCGKPGLTLRACRADPPPAMWACAGWDRPPGEGERLPSPPILLGDWSRAWVLTGDAARACSPRRSLPLRPLRLATRGWRRADKLSMPRINSCAMCTCSAIARTPELVVSTCFCGHGVAAWRFSTCTASPRRFAAFCGWRPAEFALGCGLTTSGRLFGTQSVLRKTLPTPSALLPAALCDEDTELFNADFAGLLALSSGLDADRPSSPVPLGTVVVSFAALRCGRGSTSVGGDSVPAVSGCSRAPRISRTSAACAGKM
mmetsp:Transcript_24249/g.61696  ORF Transcript_24249/g.61696 Transcript_24249/m.61696 type:complete len:504 (-) Transcript_24249:1950-3461(-)